MGSLLSKDKTNSYTHKGVVKQGHECRVLAEQNLPEEKQNYGTERNVVNELNAGDEKMLKEGRERCPFVGMSNQELVKSYQLEILY